MTNQPAIPKNVRGFWVVEGYPITNEITQPLFPIATREAGEEFVNRCGTNSRYMFVVEGDVNPVFYPSIAKEILERQSQ